MSFINQTDSKLEMLQGVQVLVVDNDRDSSYLYTVLLNNLGATVTTADSIKEALEALRRFVPNILICEMRFLGESINTLTTQLSASEVGGDHIPVIAITAWLTDSLAQILEADFEDYLLKPIDPDQLVALVREFASGRRSSPSHDRVRLKMKLEHRYKKLAAVSL